MPTPVLCLFSANSDNAGKPKNMVLRNFTANRKQGRYFEK